MEQLVEAYKQHNDRFGLWEEFPYPYLMRGRRLTLHARDYSQFFEKYEQQGITHNQSFFNFCKTVVYEYSPSLKEELIRQEALVRLFAGIYYVMKYGWIIGIIMLSLHSAAIVAAYLFNVSFFVTTYSWNIALCSILVLMGIRHLDKEILEQLRSMRAKELNLAFDGFFIVSRKNNLEIG